MTPNKIFVFDDLRLKGIPNFDFFSGVGGGLSMIVEILRSEIRESYAYLMNFYFM